MTWGLWLYFPPKEGVLRIFIVLKNPSPLSGLNLRPLGPMATTLTPTPPKRREGFLIRDSLLVEGSESVLGIFILLHTRQMQSCPTPQHSQLKEDI
jgi:hypothetical protein